MKYIVNGVKMTPEEYRKQRDAQPKNNDWLKGGLAHVQTCRANNPQTSESSGVVPNQVAEEREELKKHHEAGELTGVTILDNGAVQYTSEGEQGRKGWHRYRGHVDYEGGFAQAYTPDDRYGQHGQS